jgi:3-hydroxyisobutyrate dehydrogenase
MKTATSGKTLRAGVIGLGQIGGGVAICLARHQRALAVYDVRPQAAEQLAGVPPALASPAEVARNSDVVMIAVLNGEQVKAVLEGPDGILAAAHPGLSLVVLSTITMAELKQLQAIIAGTGVALLDCGVTGGQLSDQGGMISMIGGEESDVERILPVLEEFNASVHHMGGSGAGMATKIARNMIHFTLWRAGVEGAMLATKAGVDLNKFIELVEAASKNPGASVTVWMDPDRVAGAARMAQDPMELRRQTLGLQQKDLEAAKALAAELGVNVAAADAAWRFGKETYRLDD